MARKTKTAKAAPRNTPPKKGKKAAAPKPEMDLEDELLDIAEVIEADEPDEKPAKKGRAKAEAKPAAEKATPKASPKASKEELLEKLNQILEAELSGVVRYLHYSFMIFGPNRIPITQWFRSHATEGITHAVTIGEKITSLGGHPSLKVMPVPETNKHNVLQILDEGLDFERDTLKLYYELLETVAGDVALEDTVRALIKEETDHIEEVEKMIRK